MIVGVWKTDRVKMVQNLMKNDKRKFEEMPEIQKNNFQKNLESRVYHFYQDNTFMATWVLKDRQFNVIGKWKLIDSKTLAIILPEEEKKYTVDVDDESLVITPLELAGGMFQKLIFNRSKEL